MKTSKKISAGDTLTVGDLTDDYRGAVIEVYDGEGTVMRFVLSERSPLANGYELYPLGSSPWFFENSDLVKVIAPPPVVQPDEPTEIGQCIRIEGDDEFWGVVADPGDSFPIRDMDGRWLDWEAVLYRAGDRRIIVSDPPRWPDETPEADETPEVPERIEAGEWPDDDTHLREWEWIDRNGDVWRWGVGEKGRVGWTWYPLLVPISSPHNGPWTRGDLVK